MAASFASDSEAAGEFVYTRIRTMLPARLARKIAEGYETGCQDEGQCATHPCVPNNWAVGCDGPIRMRRAARTAGRVLVGQPRSGAAPMA